MSLIKRDSQKQVFFLCVCVCVCVCVCLETSLLTLLALTFMKAIYLLLQAKIYCSINPLFLRALFVISFNLHFFGGFVVVTINAPREF